MKNENFDINNLPELPQTITRENMHLFPKKYQEVLEFAEKNKGKIILTEKYLDAQQDYLLEQVKETFMASPNLLPKQVLLNILEKLPDFLPANNLVEVTKIITSTWKDLQKKVAA